MNKKVFSIGKYEVKRRDILIVVMVILLLLLLFRCSNLKEREKQIEDKVSEVCVFPKDNIKDLDDLLARSDFCDEEWFKDFDEYIERIEEQNKVLKKQTGTKQKLIYKEQKKLIKALKDFREKQTEDTLDRLEDAVKRYKKLSSKGCDDVEKKNKKD